MSSVINKEEAGENTEKIKEQANKPYSLKLLRAPMASGENCFSKLSFDFHKHITK